MAEATMLVLPVPFLQDPPGRPPGCPKPELMSKPTILTVDDDSQVSAAITRDLASQYGGNHRIIGAASGPRHWPC
jgi:hypothetical protein